MIEVAGTWDLGWSAPLTEIDQWWAVMRSYNLKTLHMTPVSGIQHKMLREYASFDELLEENKHLTFVFVDERSEVGLDEFQHPEHALYIFGKANGGHRLPKDYLSVRIDCPQLGMLWPHQALAVVLHDRYGR